MTEIVKYFRSEACRFTRDQPHGKSADRKLHTMTHTTSPPSFNLRSRFASLGMAARQRVAVVLLSAGVVVAGLLSGVAQAQSAAASPVGMVKVSTGQAFIESNGHRSLAALGMPVYMGSRLTTTGNGTLGVTFRDETVMSLGPDTQLVIDQYVFSPRQAQVGLIASLARGTLNYVSGQIAKIRPESVNVNTPTGMIGVRGTQFVVRVDPQ
jgi:FecR protein